MYVKCKLMHRWCMQNLPAILNVRNGSKIYDWKICIRIVKKLSAKKSNDKPARFIAYQMKRQEK